ncbi:helix-turn-helix transcriptional regulator [Kushneria indalinina]|uniref:Helix-turn-helix protein n=1 Tax=Kushneria indalinina DSM 14324 TaxID=1122140 RepID=A0A3D9DXQ7_9GAMM|nr:helix-turn-helix transcriptional regulator [Kushneria indalinina]REC95567.1 helix-turn-helix protein [Kushneria indalinina DSM 14324]
MTPSRTLDRTRHELAQFLMTRRARVSPQEAGLPTGQRRRTPGLRREEVAALAGVGVTWYTWLEQGREINVSARFLDNLSRALRLDAAERRHLFLLTHQRPPVEPGQTWCEVPSLIKRLMADLPQRPCYVLNLRWDVLTWNEAGDRLFNFSDQPPEQRNLLWMLFTEPAMQTLIDDWDNQASAILSSFRRDYARASDDPAIQSLVQMLEGVSATFRTLWHQHDVHAPCQGRRWLNIEDIGPVEFEHTSLIIDESRHLRLVYYAALEGQPGVPRLLERLSGSGGGAV